MFTFQQVVILLNYNAVLVWPGVPAFERMKRQKVYVYKFFKYQNLLKPGRPISIKNPRSLN